LFGILLREKYGILIKHINKILAIDIIIYGICLYFWQGKYYEINLRMFSWDSMRFFMPDIPIALCHLVTSFSGSLLFFIIFQKVYKKNTFFASLSRSGRYTLGIYILQVTIIETILTELLDFQNMNIWIYSLVIGPAIALVMHIICIGIIKLINKNKYIEFILFGGSLGKNKH
jgi:hypothetical protein